MTASIPHGEVGFALDTHTQRERERDMNNVFLLPEYRYYDLPYTSLAMPPYPAIHYSSEIVESK